jgi:hypothetical protein
VRNATLDINNIWISNPYEHRGPDITTSASTNVYFGRFFSIKDLHSIYPKSAGTPVLIISFNYNFLAGIVGHISPAWITDFQLLCHPKSVSHPQNA